MALPLASALHPCQNVRRTCQRIVDDVNVCSVTIVEEPMHNMVVVMQDTTGKIEWDTEGWHYSGRDLVHTQERNERVLLYILALDAINFCFWPFASLDVTKNEPNRLEYEHVAMALSQLAEQGDDKEFPEYFFHPLRLATITVDEMKDALEPLFPPSEGGQHYQLANLDERCRLWNELGSVLLQECETGNAFEHLLQKCQGSAPRLVQWLVQHVPGFRDEAIDWNGKWVAFYKRSQIAVADLNAALSLDLTDMDQLTTFADYRVPQLLRQLGILEYSDSLAQRVDSKQELERNDELSIRAATVIAVDRLVQVYLKHYPHHTHMTAVQMDWHLWQVGEAKHQKGELKPHHRVKTIFY